MSYIESMLNLKQELTFEPSKINAFLVNEGFEFGEASNAFEKVMFTEGFTVYRISIYVYESHIHYNVKYADNLFEKNKNTIRYTKDHLTDFINKYNKAIELINHYISY